MGLCLFCDSAVSDLKENCLGFSVEIQTNMMKEKIIMTVKRKRKKMNF